MGQDELQQISGLVCQLQGRTRVQGAQESALPRAWRQFLGGFFIAWVGFGKGHFSCEDTMAFVWVKNCGEFGTDIEVEIYDERTKT